MSELDPNIILAGKSQPVYDPAQLVAKRQAIAAGALQNQQRQQALDTGAQGLLIGAEGLQADRYKNQATAVSLADQATMTQTLRAMSMGVAPPPPAGVLAPAGSPAAAGGVRLPSGLIDRTGTTGQVAGPNDQVVPGIVGVSPAAAPGSSAAPSAPAVAPAAPAAGGGFDYDEYLNRIRGKVSPGAYFNAAQMALGTKEKLATLDKTRGEISEANAKLETGRNNFLSNVARNIQGADYSPGSLELGLHMAESMGGSDGPEMARHVAQIRQAIAQNPDNARKIIDAVAAGADAPTLTAQSRATTADTGASKQRNEAPKQIAEAELATRQNNAISIASAPDLAAAHRLAFKLPTDQQAPFLAALERPDWQNAVTRIGLNPDQAVTTAATAARDTEAVKNNAILRQQGNARIGIEAQNLAIRRVEADPFGTMGINKNPPKFADPATGQALTGQPFIDSIAKSNPGLAAQIKASANGSSGYVPRGKQGEQFKQMVYQFDPTANDQRLKMRTAFTSGKQGQNIGNNNTAVVHLQQAVDIFDSMHNKSFQPGNEAYNWFVTKFGSAAATNYGTVKTALAGEMASALKGTATDPEIAHVLESLNTSSSPEQALGAAKVNLHVLGAKLNTYDEQYHQAMGKDDPWSPILPAARAVFNRNGIRPLGSDTAAPANPFRKK